MKTKRVICMIVCLLLCCSLWGCDGEALLRDAYLSAPELDLAAYQEAVAANPQKAMLQYEFRIYQYTGETHGFTQDGALILGVEEFNPITDMWITYYDILVYLDESQIRDFGVATYTFAGILMSGEDVPTLQNAIVIEKVS